MARMIFIVSANYEGGLSLKLTFNDNTTKILDFTSFFKTHSHPQYNKYSNPKLFKKFKIEQGNVVWGKNWDLMFPIENLLSGDIG